VNRRAFLKSLTAVCGVVVVCPGELLKGPVIEIVINANGLLSIKDKSDRWRHCIIVKARQEGYSTLTREQILRMFQGAVL